MMTLVHPAAVAAVAAVLPMREADLHKLRASAPRAENTDNDTVPGPKPIDKSLIYKVLSNRVYLGEIRHRDQWYPGEHPSIVEQNLWDAAQAILARNPQVRGNATRARVPFLLKGIVQGSDGRALTPWFTRKKNGRLYRYYLPTRENKEHAGASGLPASRRGSWRRRCWSSCAGCCARPKWSPASPSVPCGSIPHSRRPRSRWP
jgi:Recombinase